MNEITRALRRRRCREMVKMRKEAESLAAYMKATLERVRDMTGEPKQEPKPKFH